jgi:hypothetical protein
MRPPEFDLLSLPGLTGQSSNPRAIDVAESDRRAQSLYCAAAIKDGAMRFAYCALIAPRRVRWLLDRPVKPGNDGEVCRSL